MASLSAAVAGIAAALVVCRPGSLAAQPRTAAALAAGPAVATLVLPVDVSAGIPTVEVMVNGRGPLRLGLDTGAMGGVYLFGGGAERVGLAPVGAIDASDPSGRNPQRLSTYGQVEVILGGRSFRSEVAGAPGPGPGRLSDLDGIFGLEVFGPALVTIDFVHRRLVVERPGLPAPDGRSVFAYEGSLPRLPLQVEGHLLDAYLDTGDVRAGIVLPEAVADQLAGRAAAIPAGVAHTISAAAPMFSLSLLGPPRIGDTVLASTDVQFPSVAPIGIVGAAALEGLVVRIDTLNRRVQVLSVPPMAIRSSFQDLVQPPAAAVLAR